MNLSFICKLSLSALFVLLAFPGVGWSQQNHSTKTDDASDYEVTTTRKQDQFATDPQYASGYATRFELDPQRGDTDLTDLVEDSSGTYLRQTGSSGRGGYLTIRGGNARESKILLNGMPIGKSAGLGFNLSQFSLSGIDSVQISRGPAALVNGAGALTGSMAISIEPRKKPGWHVDSYLGGGSFGTYAGGAEGGTSDKESGGELTFNWRRSEGDFSFVDRQGTEHKRINNEHRQLNAVATGYTKPSDESRIRVTGLWNHWSGGVPGVSEFQSKFNETRRTENHFIGVSNWQSKGLLNGDGWALDGRAYLGSEIQHGEYSNFSVYPGGGTFRRETSYYSIQTGFEQTLWADSGHLLQTVVRGGFRDYQMEILESPANRAEDIEAKRFSVEAAIFDEFLFWQDKLSLIGGANGIFIDNQNQGATYLSVAPAGGFIAGLNDWFKLKGNLGYSFRPPDFDELYTRMTGLRGNPDLKPERALIWDAGLQLGSDKWPLQLEAVYFENRIDRYIEFISKSAWLYEADNLSDVFIRGLETSVSASIAKRLDLKGNYTFLETAEYGSASLPLPGRPDHRLKTGLTGELSDLGPIPDIPSLKISGTVRYRGKITLDTFGNRANPSYLTVDSALSITPSSDIQIGIDVRNITDQKSRVDFFQRPLPSRSVFLNLHLSRGNKNET